MPNKRFQQNQHKCPCSLRAVTVTTLRPSQSALKTTLSPKPYDPTLSAEQIANFYSTLSRPKWKGETTPRYLSTSIKPAVRHAASTTRPRVVVKQINDAAAVRQLPGRATTTIPSFIKKLTPTKAGDHEFEQRITYRQLHPHEVTSFASVKIRYHNGIQKGEEGAKRCIQSQNIISFRHWHKLIIAKAVVFLLDFSDLVPPHAVFPQGALTYDVCTGRGEGVPLKQMQ